MHAVRGAHTLLCPLSGHGDVHGDMGLELNVPAPLSGKSLNLVLLFSLSSLCYLRRFNLETFFK